jgi:ABC-type nickel/cobalt efflux system permease component RcnA
VDQLLNKLGLSAIVLPAVFCFLAAGVAFIFERRRRIARPLWLGLEASIFLGLVAVVALGFVLRSIFFRCDESTLWLVMCALAVLQASYSAFLVVRSPGIRLMAFFASAGVTLLALGINFVLLAGSSMACVRYVPPPS